ncbi:telomerase reverse transcriptase [Colletotrichum higginsianum]|nr:telomerase reverse transcriptase [Colletotrichum higginsianum]
MTLHVEEDVLLEILTYHQVPANFLTFLTSGSEAWSFASSIRFAGFVGRSTLRPLRRQPSLVGLGRSGTHVQVCLTLFSIREYPLHALPGESDPERTPRWETHSAIVYLHFDFVEGTAVWLLVSPRCYHPEKGKGTQNLLWNTLKGGLASDMSTLTCLDIHERFRVSLSCLLAVARWSIGMFSHHLQDTERRLSDLTKPYVYPFDNDDDMVDESWGSIHAQDLRRMAFLMESRHGGVLRAENNLRVLRRLLKFINDEVYGDLEVLEDRQTDKIRVHVQDFAEKVTLVIEELEDLLDRALALDKLAKNREVYTKIIAELTAEDSSAMKQLSFIALILLPVTVVSAVLSTDIVKFQDLASENEKKVTGSTSESAVPIFNFSVAAFGTWAVASVLTTIATIILVKPIENRGRRSTGRVGGGGGGEGANNCNTWASRVKRWMPIARDSAGQDMSRSDTERTNMAAALASASSMHRAPTVTKTVSNSPEVPMVDEGVPGPVRGPPTLKSRALWRHLYPDGIVDEMEGETEHEVLGRQRVRNRIIVSVLIFYHVVP